MVGDVVAREARPAGNPVVAKRQRAFIRSVEAQQPVAKPLLVQPLRLDAEMQTKTPWVPLDSTVPSEEVWTRSIAVNEIVFDFDTHDWPHLRRVAERVSDVMTYMEWPHLKALTGGKGVHIHGWLDLASVRAPVMLFLRARRLDVCPWAVLRETVADAVLDAADVPREGRWSKDGGMMDRSKVWWSASRQGSMIREFGCRGGRGFRKTVVDEVPEVLGPAPLRFPVGPAPAWSVPAPLVQRYIRELEAKTEAAQAARNAPPVSVDDVTLEDVPCAHRTMTEGVGRGNRHVAHLNLVATAYRLGCTFEEACDAVSRAVERHGLSEGDTVEKLVRQVYEGRWRPPENLSCPSPHVSGLCNPNACALSRHLTFE